MHVVIVSVAVKVCETNVVIKDIVKTGVIEEI